MSDKQKPYDKHSSSDYLYLEKLKFNPALRRSWLNFFVTNFRVVVLLIFLLSMWGIYSYISLPRESNPEVKIPIAVVTTVFPGASPSDIEELVTKKLETGISGVKGISKLTSNSTNSFCSIVVEFDAQEDLNDSIRRLKDEVDLVKKDLPDDAEDPQVSQISFDDTPILSISLTGTNDGFTLRQEAEDIQDELEKIPDVREVQVSGGNQREFEVAYNPDKLNFLNVSPEQANQAIKATNLVIPGGNFEGDHYNYSIKSDARFFDQEKLGNIPITHSDNGSIVYLKDVANVQEKAIKRTIYSRLSIQGSQPKDSVSIDVIKKTGGSIIKTSDQAKKVVEDKVKTYPPGVSYAVTTDFAKIIRHDFEQLTHDFLITLVLVVGVLLLIVGLKEAFVAGLAIPLVFFVTFGVMLMTGISLNFLSIFSLLLSLGLLVDDAIVVVSATKQYLKTGKFTPEEAVLLVLNDFKWVLTTTTLTTVWAFLPLLLSTGIIGSYIRSIPITVSVTLMGSLLVALMINHPLAAVLERIRLSRNFFYIIEFLLASFAFLSFQQKTPLYYSISFVFVGIFVILIFWYIYGGRKKAIENENLVEKEWDDPGLIKKKLLGQGKREESTFFNKLVHGIIHFDRILPYYEKYLRAILKTKKRRIATILAIFLLFVFSAMLPVLGIVPTEFFPASDEDTLFVDIEAPVGQNLDDTEKITKQVEQVLLKYPEIANYSTLVGNPGQSREGGGPRQNSSNVASIVISLTDKEQRHIKSYDLAKKIRSDLSGIQEAKISVESASGGPPSGSAFQAQISGEDLQKLDKIAHDLKPILAEIPGVINIDISLKPAPAEYTFSLDPAKMELYGLNAAQVGSTLRMAISGTKVTTVIRQNKEIEVIATYDESKIPDLKSIENLQIINLGKQPVFLKDVAKIQLDPSVNSITRIDQKRTVILSSGVDAGTRANQVLTEFQNRMAKNYKMPTGYEIAYGGENEQNNESVLSIIRAMAIAALLIVSTLIIQFNSFKKALIVLVTFPLALIGVFIGLAIFRVNLSFPGLIGILALFGIVVKNAIILIDKINLNLKSKIPFKDAIVDAGKSRLEAIFITSICTIFGIIPITLSNELWKALGTAIIFGLSLSSFLTLILVPVLFMTLIREKERF